MEIDELIKLGFKSNESSYYPEGATYYLKNGDFTIYTSESYRYLWVQFQSLSWKLVSKRITNEILSEVLSFKDHRDIRFIGKN